MSRRSWLGWFLRSAAHAPLNRNVLHTKDATQHATHEMYTCALMQRQRRLRRVTPPPPPHSCEYPMRRAFVPAHKWVHRRTRARTRTDIDGHARTRMAQCALCPSLRVPTQAQPSGRAFVRVLHGARRRSPSVACRMRRVTGGTANACLCFATQRTAGHTRARMCMRVGDIRRVRQVRRGHALRPARLGLPDLGTPP